MALNSQPKSSGTNCCSGTPDLREINGCGQAFSVQHAMTCKKGGLVIIRHNEIGDELADIASKALTPSAVRDEPSIYPHGRAADHVTAQEAPSAGKSPISRPKSLSCDEDRGDLSSSGVSGLAGRTASSMSASRTSTASPTAARMLIRS